MRKTSGILAALLSGVSVLALASASHAQATSDSSVSEVTVTGSRLVVDGTKAQTPVTVLTAQQLTAAAPNDISDALKELPQIYNSQGTTTSPGPFSTTAGDASYLNLRNLGYNRSLVLLDGNRLPPTAAQGAVDTNTIPQALIQRVEVVTGGASAVYGSDALSGVVNFILDENFTGVKASAQGGVSDYNDVDSSKFSIAAGRDLLDGRAHVIGSFEYYQRGGILVGDRPLASQQWILGGQGTAASPYTTYRGGNGDQSADSALILVGPLTGYYFGQGGVFQPRNLGISHGSNFNQQGGDGVLAPQLDENSVVPFQNFNGFARGSYDLTPNIKLHVEGSYSLEKQDFNSYAGAFWAGQSPSTGFSIFSGNAFLTPQAQSVFNAAGVQSILFTRTGNISNPLIPQGGTDIPNTHVWQDTASDRLNAGLEGSFGKTWKWDANYSHGDAVFQSKDREPYLPNVAAALDAVRDPSGNIVCNVTLTNPGLYPGCVPLNVQGVGAPSQAAVNYIEKMNIYSVKNTMDIVNASLHGDVFDLPAGPLSAAVGAEYRNQSLLQHGTCLPSVLPSKAGLRGAPPTMPCWGVDNVGPASGSESVKEAFVEVNAPLLKDLLLVHDLTFNGAYRYTDYSTSGGVSTWKVGLSYAPISDLRFRATVSQDIRAPTLYELFAGPSVAQTILSDPHETACTPQPGCQILTIATRSGGNPNLVPEVGRTYALGAVYTPEWLAGLSLSVDGYSIKIANAIGTLTSLQILTDCESSGGTSSACANVTRPQPFSDHSPDNPATSIFQGSVNTSLIELEGVDFEASYSFAADRIFKSLDGRFTIRGLGTYLASEKTQLSPSSPILDTDGYLNNPKLRGSVSVQYQGEKFGLFLQERATGSYNVSASPPGTPGSTYYLDHGTAPNIWYSDLTVTYNVETWGQKSQVFLTINNLTNAAPPLLATTTQLAYPTFQQTYDIIGRYFTTGIRMRF